MPLKKLFISSVQAEFSEERQELYEYIISDALLGRFFQPFLFEHLPATDTHVDRKYLNEVEHCDIYIGLIGSKYGYEDTEGISPTEHEFDHATQHHKTRFIFISGHASGERHPKVNRFIAKVESSLIRKVFLNIQDLKAGIYSSLVSYLLDKEIIRTVPFDAAVCDKATLDAIDPERIKSFIRLAASKRGFPLPETAGIEEVLTHLNLFDNGKLTNAAILLFGYDPQRFFVNAEVRCASFYGVVIEKPLASYKVFKGDLFEQIRQTEEFVLSKLDYAIETRSDHTSIPGKYEIPRELIAEAIVNAIAHRDYTCNGSVQVMIFRDRIEVWNPGTLPLGWTTEKLKQIHRSIPANPLIADPMYLAGFIERLGTGTLDILRLAKTAGLPEPVFYQDEEFRTIIYRKMVIPQVIPQVTPQVTPQVHDKLTEEMETLILLVEGEMSRAELQSLAGFKDRMYFMQKFIEPGLTKGIIEMTQPDKPNSRSQKYRLTTKAISIKSNKS